MRKFDDLCYKTNYRKKYILLIDNKDNSFDYYDNNNIKNEQNEKKITNIKQKKKKCKKKFKILRNFSENFDQGFLSLESPHKSIFAKRILSEIIPHNLTRKNIVFKKRKRIYTSEHNLLILNTPKNINSFFNKNCFPRESIFKKSFLKNDSLKKRKSHNVHSNYTNLFNVKKNSLSKDKSIKNFINSKSLLYDNQINDSYIKDIIKEDHNNNISEEILEDNTNNNISEENTENKKENANNDNKPKKQKIKINFKDITFLKPKKLVFKNKNKLDEEKDSLNNKKRKSKNNKIPKPSTPQKLYNKKCDMKKHFCHEKFISKFLTPINQFINNDFHFTDKEYEKINKNIHDLNYSINNNDYSIYINKRKKEKYKAFIPPKIPNIHKKIESKYFNIINELKNYKFKI